MKKDLSVLYLHNLVSWLYACRARLVLQVLPINDILRKLSNTQMFVALFVFVHKNLYCSNASTVRVIIFDICFRAKC